MTPGKNYCHRHFGSHGVVVTHISACFARSEIRLYPFSHKLLFFPPSGVGPLPSFCVSSPATKSPSVVYLRSDSALCVGASGLPRFAVGGGGEEEEEEEEGGGAGFTATTT